MPGSSKKELLIYQVVSMKHPSVKKVGGEFAIDPSTLNLFANYTPKQDLIMYSSGRSALMVILHYVGKLKRKTIHVPYYICPSVIDTCKKTGFLIKFYELKEDNFLFPLDYLPNVKFEESILTVNYFGFTDDNIIIKTIKSIRPDIFTISDQVQSFWTLYSSKADFSFTSLRKHFAIPDGALIHTNVEIFTQDKDLKASNSYNKKLLGSIFKFLELDDELYLKFFKEGEVELAKEEEPTQSSIISKYLFEKIINIENIARKRKENNKLIYEMGKMKGINFIFPYNESTIPLNVPILVKNRNDVRNRLAQNNIFLPVHWPLTDYNSISEISRLMAINSLSLLVDQRISANDIERQIECLTG